VVSGEGTMIYSNVVPIIEPNGDIVQFKFQVKKADGSLETVATIALSRHAATGMHKDLENLVRSLYKAQGQLGIDQIGPKSPSDATKHQ
jgi:hypothetical protein